MSHKIAAFIKMKILLVEEREKIIEFGKLLIKENLTKGTSGNLSICNRENNLMAITPSGIPYYDMKPEDIVLIDINSGKIVDGDKVPSSESDMHRIFYKYRDDINALIHTHAKYSTAVACTGEKLPAIHYEIAVAGVDVLCAKYATYGTVKLAKNAFEAMKDRKAVLLSNHGLLTGGKTIEQAMNITKTIEFSCELYCISKSLGEVNILPQEEMLLMIERFKNYGKRMEEHEEI